MSGGQRSTQASAAGAADAITAERNEAKYVVQALDAQQLVRTLVGMLPVHRFTGPGANFLPDPDHFVTSVYFDTAARDHYKAACADADHNVKLRAREYYDVHPALAELATHVSQIVRYRPWVWFEVKQRDQGRTQKRRIRLAKSDVPAFLRGELRAVERTGAEASGADASDQDFAAIVAQCGPRAAPLAPSCVVHYRRIAFQDPSATLRITVDLEIAFYRPPPDLWTRTHALVRGTFGPPSGVERDALVEVKSRGATPSWLVRALAEVGARSVVYSKFVRAGHVV